jgi:hypothetical protein
LRAWAQDASRMDSTIASLGVKVRHFQQRLQQPVPQSPAHQAGTPAAGTASPQKAPFGTPGNVVRPYDKIINFHKVMKIFQTSVGLEPEAFERCRCRSHCQPPLYQGALRHLQLDLQADSHFGAAASSGPRPCPQQPHRPRCRLSLPPRYHN